VSHDRYFVDRLATKIVSVGGGDLEVYPGTYEEFLWSRARRAAAGAARAATPAPPAPRPEAAEAPARSGASPRTGEAPHTPAPAAARGADRRRADAEARRARRARRARDQRARRVEDLESRITDREREIRTLEEAMAAADFYDDRQAAEAAIARHQSLMWEVGDLMQQWEALQTADQAD
jgi:ATP-binding cassette subfamily F protein 3